MDYKACKKAELVELVKKLEEKSNALARCYDQLRSLVGAITDSTEKIVDDACKALDKAVNHIEDGEYVGAVEALSAIKTEMETYGGLCVLTSLTLSAVDKLKPEDWEVKDDSTDDN